MRETARRSLLALGARVALLTAAAAGDASAALAAPQARLLPALIHGGAGSGQVTPELPGPSRPVPDAVAVAGLSGSSRATALAPLHGLLQADLLVVAPTSLPSGIAAAVRRMRGVVAAEPIDAARIQVKGKFTAMLGVNPSTFRAFAARPTAQAAGLWRNVLEGGIAVSYTMGKLAKLPLGGLLRVSGRHIEDLPVAGFGTVGIAGVDAVVSDATARSLGIPAGNAIVISAPHAVFRSLMAQIKKLLPRGAAIAPLVAQTVTPAVGATGTSTAPSPAGVSPISFADGPGL